MITLAQQQARRHNMLKDFDDPPRGLEARQITVCLRPDQWGKVEWLAAHLKCETERAATILLTQAVMELDIIEVERNHGAPSTIQKKTRPRTWVHGIVPRCGYCLSVID
jgi:hypothetical protein